MKNKFIVDAKLLVYNQNKKSCWEFVDSIYVRETISPLFDKSRVFNIG